MDSDIDISVESALYDYFILNAERACVGEMVSLLVEGADVNYTGASDKTALHLYLHTKHPRPDVIIALLEAGAVVDSPERCCGASPAHLYVINAADVSMQVLEAMLTWGARIGDALTEQRFMSSVLREAVTRRPFHAQTEAIMDLLLSMGADINFSVGVGRTPLHSCLTGMCTDPQTVAAMLARGADVRAQDAYDMTPMAVLMKSSRATVQLLDMLVAAGSDLSASDFCGNTPLHQHALSARPRAAVFRRMIELGADPRATNMFGNTPMHCLAMHNTCRRSMTLPFVEAGVGIDVENMQFRIGPLHLAAAYNNTLGCRNLLRQGADPVAASASGRLPLANMVINRNRTTAEAALATRPPPSAVIEALTQAVGAGASAASRLCVAYVVARVGVARLPEAVMREHAEFARDCAAEAAALRGIVLGAPAVTALDIMRNPDVLATVVSGRARCIVRRMVYIYREEMFAALARLRHRSLLVARLRREVGPCSLPSELVERVLASVPLPDLRRSCGMDN